MKLKQKPLMSLGLMSGTLLVYGMVIGLPTVFSGLFNIDSALGLLIQLGSLLLFLMLIYSFKKDNDKIIILTIGFLLGTFIGLSFISTGIWHGIYN